MGFGQEAPSGVLTIGFALVARDVLQNKIGCKPVLLATALGVLVYLFVNSDLAIASGVAFALGETADLLVYSPLRSRSLLAAVTLSGIVGGVMDSLVFLQIAFDSTEYWQGQVLEKSWMAILGGLLIVTVRRHRTAPQIPSYS